MRFRPKVTAIAFLSSASSFGIQQQTTAPASAPEDSGVIVFASDRDGDSELYRINPDGSGLTQLTENEFKDTSPAWSPDGTRIAFVSDRDGEPAVYAMAADGTNVVRIAESGTAEAIRISWSPDGQRIAFDTEMDIWVCNSDGSDLKKIAEDAMWPAWSPDGKTIAFNRGQLCCQSATRMSGNGRKCPGKPPIRPTGGSAGKLSFGLPSVAH